MKCSIETTQSKREQANSLNKPKMWTYINKAKNAANSFFLLFLFSIHFCLFFFCNFVIHSTCTVRDVESRIGAETYCARVKRCTLVTHVSTGAKSLSFFFFLSFLYIFKGKILEIRVEELLYSPDGDSISCFIHIYILIFIFICIVLNPPVQWNACSAFWGDISFSWGYWG